MDEYISRKVAIDTAIDAVDDWDGGCNKSRATIIENALKALPSADVEPARETAEWVYGEKDGADGWYCSKCRFHIPWYYDYYGLKNIDFIRDFHTCPHCDAKMVKYTGMDGEQNV